MTISLVQQATGTSGAGSTSVSATLPAPATAGNFLIVAAGLDKAAGTLTPPASFVPFLSHVSASLGTYFGGREAAGGETSFTVSKTGASTNGDTLWVGEFADSGPGSWVGFSSATHPTDESTVTSWSSGTAPDPGTTCAALAIFTIDSGSNATGSQAWSNGFAQLRGWANSSIGDVAVGWLSSTAGGSTKETTHTHTPTGDQMSGAILTFGRDGAAPTATAVVPVSGQFTEGILEIEFTPGVWTDVSPWYRLPVSLRYGRPTPLEPIGAGVGTFILSNPDGRFMPDNPGSPYWPEVVRSKRIRWRVSKAGQTWTRFTGWIQAWQPSFPTDSALDGIVTVTAVDALGLLAQRKLRSNWTEVALWRARLGGVRVDAWEAAGQASGFTSKLTNYSTDDARSKFSATTYSTSWPTLTFSGDQDLSIGPVVSSSPDSNGFSCSIVSQIPSNSLTIQFLIKTPTEIPAAGLPWFMVTLWNIGKTVILNQLLIENNGAGDMRLILQTGAGVTLGTIRNTIAHGQWVMVRVTQNAVTPANSDWFSTELGSGIIGSLTNVARDVRTLGDVEFPAFAARTSPASFGGLVGIGQTVGPTSADADPTGVQGTLSNRLASLINTATPLPVAFTMVGTLTTQVLTGKWSDRTWLEVGQEAMLSGLGIAFARTRDSRVLLIGGDQCYPEKPLISLDVEGETLGTLEMAATTDAGPTRVVIDSPGSRRTRFDVAAEAGGEIRELTVSTICANTADADAVGDFLLAHRTSGLRISRVTIDLTSPEIDYTAELFDETATLAGLYPTQRIRLDGLPQSHFGNTSRDFFVEGWEEHYEPNRVYLVVDASPAVDPPARPRAVVAPVAAAAAVAGFTRTGMPMPRPFVTSTGRQ